MYVCMCMYVTFYSIIRLLKNSTYIKITYLLKNNISIFSIYNIYPKRYMLKNSPLITSSGNQKITLVQFLAYLSCWGTSGHAVPYLCFSPMYYVSFRSSTCRSAPSFFKLHGISLCRCTIIDFPCLQIPLRLYSGFCFCRQSAMDFLRAGTLGSHWMPLSLGIVTD